MPKVYVKTLGCRLNQAESERMARTLLLDGYQLARNEKEADIRLVNTCTVTSEAARKSRSAARPVRPGQNIIVTGCHSEVKPEDFEGADLVVANADKDRVAALARERFGIDGQALGMEYRRGRRIDLYPLVRNRTRAFVKIQDGCNLHCSFCLTQIARGASRSRPVDEVVEEIARLADDGCREAVLTGVHAGSYRHGRDSLGELLDAILSRTAIPRLRLSSLEPWNFRLEWLDLWTSPAGRMCRHLHMSLQSGCDRILDAMRRPCSASTFAGKVEAIRAAVPDMGLTTDIIVGFPGETQADHQESLAFVERMAFSGAHVFSFSPRPGTHAAVLPGRVPAPVRKERLHEIRRVTDASADRYRRGLVSRRMDVLWESPEHGGTRMTGLTDTYQRVVAMGPQPRANSIVSARMTGMEGDCLTGVIESEDPR